MGNGLRENRCLTLKPSNTDQHRDFCAEKPHDKPERKPGGGRQVIRDIGVPRLILMVASAAWEANMGLQISTRKSGNVIILDLVGRLIIGTSNDTLSAELRKFAEAGPSEVVVNLVAVSQMDSSGIPARWCVRL